MKKSWIGAFFCLFCVHFCFSVKNRLSDADRALIRAIIKKDDGAVLTALNKGANKKLETPGLLESPLQLALRCSSATIIARLLFNGCAIINKAYYSDKHKNCKELDIRLLDGYKVAKEEEKLVYVLEKLKTFIDDTDKLKYSVVFLGFSLRDKNPKLLEAMWKHCASTAFDEYKTEHAIAACKEFIRNNFEKKRQQSLYQFVEDNKNLLK